MIDFFSVNTHTHAHKLINDFAEHEQTIVMDINKFVLELIRLQPWTVTLRTLGIRALKAHGDF